MVSRRHWQFGALAAAAALFIAGCGGGGGDKLDVGKVVSFGDSLSDLGTYTIATSQVPGVAPYFGGRFTTNTHSSYAPTASPLSNTATIWVEWVAARVGVPITQAMLGFATTRIPCPAAANAALAGSCTAYGQGGSRVTNPNGINKSAGALTDPLVTQVAAHLTRFGNFAGNDIVFLFAGGNDALIQFEAVGLGTATPAAAVANMQTAGSELATLIKDQIVAKGATRVALLTLPDLAPSPAFSALPAPNKAILTQLSTAFNAAVLAGLGAAPVSVIDANAFFAAVVASPTTYGFVNATTTACDPAKVPPAVGGSALFCNGAPAASFTAAGLPNLNTLRTGASTSTWLFADGVHPTTGGHKALSEFVIGKIKDFGWIPVNL